MKNVLQTIVANFYLLLPKSIVLRRSSKALGDNLILSFVAREIKQSFSDYTVMVETERPELFKDNPFVDRVLPGKYTARYFKMKYQINPSIEAHILDQLVTLLPVRIERWDRKLNLYLTEKELSEARRFLPKRFVAISTAGKQTFAANRKEWGIENFLELRELLGRTEVVQLGGPKDPLLPNVLDLRGLDIRLTAGAISLAQTAVLLEGGLMHIANAVGKPCVIVYGGALKPEITGYTDNINLSTNPHCSPCFTSHQAMEMCPTMECMRSISAETVYEAVQKLLP